MIYSAYLVSTMSDDQQPAITHVVVLFYVVCFIFVGNIACGQCMGIVSIVMLHMIQYSKISNGFKIMKQFITSYLMDDLSCSIINIALLHIFRIMVTWIIISTIIITNSHHTNSKTKLNIQYFLTNVYNYNYTMVSFMKYYLKNKEYLMFNVLSNESIRNGYIWLVSHVQWALSLVVDVRRSDSNLSWNGQEVLSNSTYTISFVWE